jgi:hypothetical protein
MNDHQVERIVRTLTRDGHNVTEKDVWDVFKTGSVEPGVVGDDFDAALESAILQAFDEYGIDPNA